VIQALQNGNFIVEQTLAAGKAFGSNEYEIGVAAFDPASNAVEREAGSIHIESPMDAYVPVSRRGP
jgi:hypothetical protein